MYILWWEVLYCGGNKKGKYDYWVVLGVWFLGFKVENGDVFRDFLMGVVDYYIVFCYKWVF